MATRIIFTLLWATASFLGSALILFVSWRVYFTLTGAPTNKPSDQTLAVMGLSLAFLPIAIGIAFTILGIRGWLPGTRRKS